MLQRLVVRSHHLLGHHQPLLALFVLEVELVQQESQGLVTVKIASSVEVVPKGEAVCSKKAPEVHAFFILAGHNAFPAKGYFFLGKEVDFPSAFKQGKHIFAVLSPARYPLHVLPLLGGEGKRAAELAFVLE